MLSPNQSPAFVEPSSVFDPSAFDRLSESVNNDTAFLADILADYLDDARAHLRTMQEAVDAADAAQLERTAHSLKSTSETVGAEGLAAVCRNIETLAHKKKLEAAAQRVPVAAKQFDAVASPLRERLDALNAQ